MHYNYPLELSFKLLAIGPQIFVRDTSGNEVLYVHMKAFKLKEAISVYKDSQKGRVLFTIKANKIIDFSAEYHITNEDGYRIGSVKREGMKSLLKASYNVIGKDGMQSHTIKEDAGIIRVLDSLFGSIPVLGLLAGFVFHPSYTVSTMTETPVIRIEKKADLFEGKFLLDLVDTGIDSDTEQLLLMSSLMMILLERDRG